MQTTRRLRLAVIAAAVLILLAQGVATALLLQRSHDAALAAADDTASRLGRAVEASINRNFVQVDAMLAGLPAILAPFTRDGRFDANGAGRVMRELNNQNFTFRTCCSSARTACRSRPASRSPAAVRCPSRSVPPSSRPARAAAGVAIGGPVRNPATGEWALFFARPVTCRDRRGDGGGRGAGAADRLPARGRRRGAGAPRHAGTRRRHAAGVPAA
jgi:hypothetical protein